MAALNIQIPEIESIRKDVLQLRNMLENLSKEKEKPGITFYFSPDDKIKADLAAKYLGCQKKQIKEFVEKGLLSEPDGRGRFIVAEIIELKKTLNNEAI